MTEEVSREIKNELVVVTYDDGSIRKLPLNKAPQNIEVDAQFSPDLCEGHVFKEVS